MGTGAIAQRAAYLAKAFGMKVIGVSKSGKNVEQFDEVYTIEELDDVIEKANIIVNALPETEETIYLLKRKDFIQMDNNALFINVGRGTIVDEEVLINVLKDRLIRHAYLDVLKKNHLVRTILYMI